VRTTPAGDKWLWEQAALGSGGENICFDPLGTHTRAFITDIRPKLFDGSWKENIGGGDYIILFGADGTLQYLKSLDPQLLSSGPCFSEARYSAITLDESITSSVTISGSRTDDLVRVFMDVRLDVLGDIEFSRLAFFQMSAEVYSYGASFQRFAWGGSGTQTTYMPRDCSAGSGSQMRSAESLYAADGGVPFREAMNGSAPWWVAFENNTLEATSDSMYFGDRGLVIRSFEARLGGQEQASPSFSVLCDKIELGTPAGLSQLAAGDYVTMSLELLVLPRAQEYEQALQNTGSRTLRDQLNGLSTSERVRAQALGGELHVTALKDARVDSQYPVRVFATAGTNALFKVQSKDAAGAVSAMDDWCVGNLKQDRWCCAASCGTCGDTASGCQALGAAGSCCTDVLSSPCLTESQHSCVDPTYFEIEGVHAAPLGFVPILISGLTTHLLPAGHGLWLRPQDASSFTKVAQGTGNEYWQTNFDRASGMYEIVYNVELKDASTTVAFGTNPDSWAPSPPPPSAPPPPPTTPPAAPPAKSLLKTGALAVLFKGIANKLRKTTPSPPPPEFSH